MERSFNEVFEVITRPAFDFLESNNLIRPIHDIGREEVMVYILHLQNIEKGDQTAHIAEKIKAVTQEV